MEEQMRMFVNGEAMRGFSLHKALEGSTFCGETETDGCYRFFCVGGLFPGLAPAVHGGVAVPGELYLASYEVLRDNLLPSEPPELELGVIRLHDGSGALCMLMRAWALRASGTQDISGEGGWRRFRQGLKSRRPECDLYNGGKGEE